MNINKKFSKQVLDILNKILEQYLYFGFENKEASYKYLNKEWYDPKIEEAMIIRKLEFWGAITNVKYDHKTDEEHFTVIEPKFNEVYKRFEKLNIKNKSNKNILISDNVKLKYDPKNGKLFINDQNILISKNLDTNQHHLLKIIFEDPTRIWNYDEIHEKIEGIQIEYKKEYWRKYYNAAYDINNKVAYETNIKKFLKITKNTVNITLMNKIV